MNQRPKTVADAMMRNAVIRPSNLKDLVSELVEVRARVESLSQSVAEFARQEAIDAGDLKPKTICSQKTPTSETLSESTTLDGSTPQTLSTTGAELHFRIGRKTTPSEKLFIRPLPRNGKPLVETTKQNIPRNLD